MLSYWEQQSFTEYDHIIIGSGIVGLSVAIELKDSFPSANVLVLERGLLPTGATTRNAGFACMGSVTELLDDLEQMTESEVMTLFEARKLGLEKLRRRLGESAIGYTENGSYELISNQETDALDKMDYLNALLLPITGVPAFRRADERISGFGFASSYTKALIENIGEGELSSGKMMRALMLLAMQKGVEIKTGAEAVQFHEYERHVTVEIKEPFRNNCWTITGKTLSICTNAFTSKLLPAEDIVPGRGQVLITEPVPGLKFKGIYHFDKGYYYFREIDGRVLLGGGRNLDFETEATTDFSLNDYIQADLQQKLEEIILPGTPFTIAQRWTGIMAFGKTKRPLVKKISDRVFGAFRLGGMGVALGSEVAHQLADLVIESY